MRALLTAIVGLVVAVPCVSSADVSCVVDSYGNNVCLINNGLVPPNLENVINDATYANEDVVIVRNVGCPLGWPSGAWWDPCFSPGDPTEVEVVDGAMVGELYLGDSSIATMNGGTLLHLLADHTSTVTVSGGTLQSLSADHDSTLTMTGGTVQGSLYASYHGTVMISGGAVGTRLGGWDSATIRMSGGAVGGDVWADDTSTIIFVGTDFRVDGTPVPYGRLVAETGTLTGTLVSGDLINNVFYHDAAGGWDTSTIALVPPSLNTPALSPWSRLALVAILLGAGLLAWRRQVA